MPLFGSNTTRTNTTSYSPEDRNAIARMRAANQGLFDAAGQAGSFYADAPSVADIQGYMPGLMNPYMDRVVGGLGSQYDKLRGQARLAGNAAATSAGAFGGSRHGILEAERLGQLDASQMQQIGSLLHGQYNTDMGRAMGLANQAAQVNQMRAMEPLMRAQMQQQAMSNIGPLSQQQTITEERGGSPITGLLGLGTTLASTFLSPASQATGLLGSLPALTGAAGMQAQRSRGLFGPNFNMSGGAPSPFSMVSNPYSWGTNPFSIANRNR